MQTDNRIDPSIEEILKMTPEEICSDRKLFDSFIYTDIDTAVKELHRRIEDPELEKKVKEFFGNIEIPEPLKDKPKLLMFRQIATPNYETSRFLMVADSVGIDSLFFEIHDDKFTPENELKKYLLKMLFHTGFGKNNGPKINTETIADIHYWSGKKFKEIQTSWGQSLIEFHHELLRANYNQNIIDYGTFDASEWLTQCGNSADKYYPYFFSLLIRNGILFENFLLDDKKERVFAENTIVTAFMKITNEFNIKPLIVALDPTDIEGDLFWYCHNKKTSDIVYNICKKDE